MKLSKKILAAAAIVLPLSIGTGSALAYFTANDMSSGSCGVEVGNPQTEIDEKFGNWQKQVTITNTGDVSVYVRVKAFSGSQYPLTCQPGEGWKDGGDGYYYYTPILGTEDNNKSTTALGIKIGNDNIPADATDKESFNVIVIYEKTPAVKYDESGNMVPDWDYKIVQQSEFPSEQPEGGNN